MDKKSKIFIVIIILLLILSVGVTFYRTIVLREFEIVNTDTSEENSPSDSALE